MILPYPGTPVADLYHRYRQWDLLVDSRRLGKADRTLFFALPGTRTDGHAFLSKLYDLGVRNFVVRRKLDGLDPPARQAVREVLAAPSVTALVADDPLEVLQVLAAFHRQQFQLPVIAITGSNGKTIVKDWLVSMLRERFRVCASPRSFNSQIGVPLSVWQLSSTHEVAVFEAGISRRGQMEKLAAILQPTGGVFTLLGTAHADGFHSPEQKHDQKMQLFAGAAWVVVPADDRESIKRLRKMDVEVITHHGHTRELLEVGEMALRLPFPPLPRIYLDNARSAAAAAWTLGLTVAEITRVLPGLQPLGNRLEQREGIFGGPLINDCYSNDLSALAAALEFATAQNPHERLTLILGELEPGYARATLAGLLRTYVHRLITVGRRTAGLPASHHFRDARALLLDLGNLTFGNETVLVKGASRQEMGRIADALSRRQHRTVLRVDLAAIRHNFECYRRQVATKMIVMVKASAYGGGGLPIARMLETAGVDYLAVAYPDEGSDLRRGGVRTPIMVLNAAPYSYARMQAAALEPVVHSLASLQTAMAAGLRVHLELDTGMGRLGFPPSALDDLCALLTDMGSGHLIASVFTHLAASEAAEHDTFTRAQLRCFHAGYARIAALLPQPVPWHVLNTNGISRFPEAAGTYARLGIGLYGIGDAERAGLQPALRLTSRITALSERPAGTTVGYGRQGRLTRDSRIAVVAIGYADGLPRLAGNGRYALLVAGLPAPIVGAVCMDMTMIDVTDIPAAAPDTEVVVFGPEHPIEALAAAAQTIPYEILTGIGERVHRIHSQE